MLVCSRTTPRKPDTRIGIDGKVLHPSPNPISSAQHLRKTEQSDGLDYSALSIAPVGELHKAAS